MLFVIQMVKLGNILQFLFLQYNFDPAGGVTALSALTCLLNSPAVALGGAVFSFSPFFFNNLKRYWCFLEYRTDVELLIHKIFHYYNYFHILLLLWVLFFCDGQECFPRFHNFLCVEYNYFLFLPAPADWPLTDSPTLSLISALIP